MSETTMEQHLDDWLAQPSEQPAEFVGGLDIRKLRTKAREVDARLADLRAENARLRSALEPFIDDEPCSFDHHGNCQAHLVDQPCSMVAARAALAGPQPQPEVQGRLL